IPSLASAARSLKIPFLLVYVLPLASVSWFRLEAQPRSPPNAHQVPARQLLPQNRRRARARDRTGVGFPRWCVMTWWNRSPGCKSQAGLRVDEAES
ncbi:MAG TPA: hypothetical protein VIK41_22805, partial [Gemmatimonadaceae bacterium]